MKELNEPDYLLKQAERCRAAARTASDHAVRKTLSAMAKDYEDRAHAVLLKK